MIRWRRLQWMKNPVVKNRLQLLAVIKLTTVHWWESTRCIRISLDFAALVAIVVYSEIYGWDLRCT
jgi:hypothetical protein